MTDKSSHISPVCIGIIMDGNRRFAKIRGISVAEGHEQGYEKLKEAVKWAKEAGVGTLIVYAFSTENWKRDKKEVANLMNLFRFVIKEGKKVGGDDVSVRFIGAREKFPQDIQDGMERMEKETRVGGTLTLCIALSYGGRAEIVNAARQMAAEGNIAGWHNDEKHFEKFLWTAGMPAPDIIIRTGGERRLSNFLLWQCAYSELYFPDTLWPLFSREEFINILKDYAHRERRFGK